MRTSPFPLPYTMFKKDVHFKNRNSPVRSNINSKWSLHKNISTGED